MYFRRYGECLVPTNSTMNNELPMTMGHDNRDACNICEDARNGQIFCFPKARENDRLIRTVSAVLFLRTFQRPYVYIRMHREETYAVFRQPPGDVLPH